MKTVRAQTLIALLIVVAIMAVLAVVLLKGSGAFAGAGENNSPRKDGKGTTTVGLVKLSADDTVCRSNIQQVREAIIIARSNADDAPPADLTALRLPPEFSVCPLGKEPYAYDPTTGTVHCVHPGHEKY
ncbi:hypothetical protein BH11ARM1_BH11ARM1_03950 [soil metagenome]